jgi:hypothetical protein
VNPREDQSPERDDELLDRLIREAGSAGDRDFARPDEAIEAFLLGRATPAQRETLGRSLEASPEFRRELLAMMRDLEAVASRERTTSPGGERQDVPSLAEFMSAHALQLPHSRRIRMVRALSLAAVVSLIAIGSVLWLKRDREPAGPRMVAAAWHLVEQEVDPGLLLSSGVRGGEEVAGQRAFATAQDAALASFRTGLKLEGVRLVPDIGEDTSRQLAEGPARVVVVADQGNEGFVPREARSFSLPAGDASAPTVWWIGLPSRQLFKAPFTADTLIVLWPEGVDSVALLTIGYAVPGGYAAGSPQVARR